jgi:hypothetical protein
MPGPEIKAKATLDDNAFTRTLKGMETSAASTGKKIASSFTSPLLALAPAIAGAFAGGAIISGVRNIFQTGKELAELSRTTGVSTAGLLALGAQFKAAGEDADELGGALLRMQKGVGAEAGSMQAGNFNHALERLGLNIKTIKSLSPETEFFTIGQAIAKIANPAERTAAAMSIFGKEGGKLVNVFTNSSFASAAGPLSEKATILARNAELFSKVSMSLERVGGIMKGFYLGIADRVASTLIPFLDKINSIDLIGIGQKFGDALVTGVRWIVEGAEIFIGLLKNPQAIFGLYADYLQFAFREGANVLYAGVKYAGEEITSVFKSSGPIMEKVTEGLKYGLLAAAETFIGVNLTGIATVVRVTKAGFDWVVENFSSHLVIELAGAALKFNKYLLEALTSPVKLLSEVGDLFLTGANRPSLSSALLAAAHGKDEGLGGAFGKQAMEDAKRAGAAFLTAGSLTGHALASTAFKVDDVAGAGAYQQRLTAGVEGLRQQGEGTVAGFFGASNVDQSEAPQAPAEEMPRDRNGNLIIPLPSYNFSNAIGGHTGLNPYGAGPQPGAYPGQAQMATGAQRDGGATERSQNVIIERLTKMVENLQALQVQ